MDERLEEVCAKSVPSSSSSFASAVATREPGWTMVPSARSRRANVMPHLACPECGGFVEARDMHAVRTDAALRETA